MVAKCGTVINVSILCKALTGELPSQTHSSQLLYYFIINTFQTVGKAVASKISTNSMTDNNDSKSKTTNNAKPKNRGGERRALVKTFFESRFLLTQMTFTHLLSVCE